jgi:Mg2+-importing ATPase
MLGSEMENLTDEALLQKINDIDIFARVTPDQKLRIITTLRKYGHTVGYLGDGINDLPSLHSADVGISVNTAVDVAKDTAAVVLLHKSLDVIADGIIEGRKTFSNTIKYILMATSSNFGNMFSAAGASFFLPFLPMTPVQILLTNGLYDVSQLSIPSDNVDPESLIKPRHWNINFIKDYMTFFGPLSSIFDFATFGVMLFVFHAKGPLFQTGWFIESIATEILVVFLIRTYRSPFFLSRPSKWLVATCLSLVSFGIILPFTPLARTLGLVVPPYRYFIILIILIGSYLTLVETVKHRFLKKHSM